MVFGTGIVIGIVLLAALPLSRNRLVAAAGAGAAAVDLVMMVASLF